MDEDKEFYVYKKTDAVAKFNQVVNQTEVQESEGWANGQWIKKFEDFTIKYLQFIFKKPNKSTESDLDGDGSSSVGQQINTLLQETQRIASQLDESRAAAALPYMANLTFIKNQDFNRVDTAVALQMVEKFREVVDTFEYRQLDLDSQFNKLIDFVDNTRKLAEFLLKSAGTENPQGEYSGNFIATTKAGSEPVEVVTKPASNPQGTLATQTSLMPAFVSKNSNSKDGNLTSNPQGTLATQTSLMPSFVSKNSNSKDGNLTSNQQGVSANRTSLQPTSISKNPNSAGAGLAGGTAGGCFPEETNKLLVTLIGDMYQCMLSKVGEQSPRRGRAFREPVRGRRLSKNKSPKCSIQQPQPGKQPDKKDKNWAPMMVKGYGINQGKDSGAPPNILSVTNFQNIRPLNLPGNKLFEGQLHCTFGPPEPKRDEARNAMTSPPPHRKPMQGQAGQQQMRGQGCQQPNSRQGYQQPNSRQAYQQPNSRQAYQQPTYQKPMRGQAYPQPMEEECDEEPWQGQSYQQHNPHQAFQQPKQTTGQPAYNPQGMNQMEECMTSPTRPNQRFGNNPNPTSQRMQPSSYKNDMVPRNDIKGNHGQLSNYDNGGGNKPFLQPRWVGAGGVGRCGAGLGPPGSCGPDQHSGYGPNGAGCGVNPTRHFGGGQLGTGHFGPASMGPHSANGYGRVSMGPHSGNGYGRVSMGPRSGNDGPKDSNYCQEENRLLKARLQKLEEEFRKQGAELPKYSETALALKQSMENLQAVQDENQRLRDQLKQNSDEIKRLRKDLTDSEMNLDEKLVEGKHLSKCEEQNMKLTDELAKLIEVEGKNNSLRQEVDKLRATGLFMTDREALRSKIKCLERRVQDVVQFVDRLYEGDLARDETTLTNASRSRPARGSADITDGNKTPGGQSLNTVLDRLEYLDDTLGVFDKKYDTQMGQLQAIMKQQEKQYRNIGVFAKEIKTIKDIIKKTPGQTSTYTRHAQNAEVDKNCEDCVVTNAESIVTCAESIVDCVESQANTALNNLNTDGDVKPTETKAAFSSRSLMIFN